VSSLDSLIKSSPGRGWELFSSPPHPNRLWGSTQPPIQWVPGALSLRVKQPGREAYLSPPSSAVVKNVWSYTSTPQYIIMVWYSVKKNTGSTLPLPVDNVHRHWIWKPNTCLGILWYVQIVSVKLMIINRTWCLWTVPVDDGFVSLILLLLTEHLVASSKWENFHNCNLKLSVCLCDLCPCYCCT
jgi:hypothetical protein